MDLLYSSTRNGEEKVTASKAILKGLADDGGLFVPESIPKLDVTIEELAKMSYQETAYAVMKLFFTDFTEEELKNCINKAYDSKFDTEEIAPLVEADGAYYLELFHGATIAFKDMALSILPHLLTTAAKKNQVNNERFGQLSMKLLNRQWKMLAQQQQTLQQSVKPSCSLTVLEIRVAPAIGDSY